MGLAVPPWLVLFHPCHAMAHELKVVCALSPRSQSACGISNATLEMRMRLLQNHSLVSLTRSLVGHQWPYPDPVGSSTVVSRYWMQLFPFYFADSPPTHAELDVAPPLTSLCGSIAAGHGHWHPEQHRLERCFAYREDEQIGYAPRMGSQPNLLISLEGFWAVRAGPSRRAIAR